MIIRRAVIMKRIKRRIKHNEILYDKLIFRQLLPEIHYPLYHPFEHVRKFYDKHTENYNENN
jgi:hypothetical protein